MPMTDVRSPRAETVTMFSTEGRVGRTHDLSSSGAHLEMEDPPAVGTTFPLRLQRGERLLDLEAKVVRHAEGTDGLQGVGVRWKHLDEDARRGLRALVDDHLD